MGAAARGLQNCDRCKTAINPRHHEEEPRTPTITRHKKDS